MGKSFLAEMISLVQQQEQHPGQNPVRGTWVSNLGCPAGRGETSSMDPSGTAQAPCPNILNPGLRHVGQAVTSQLPHHCSPNLQSTPAGLEEAFPRVLKREAPFPGLPCPPLGCPIPGTGCLLHTNWEKPHRATITRFYNLQRISIYYLNAHLFHG